MKKVLSLLLALSIIFTLSATAIAADDAAGDMNGTGIDNDINADTGTDNGNGVMVVNDADDNAGENFYREDDAVSPGYQMGRIAWGVGDNVINLAAGELVLVDKGTNRIIPPETHLDPGEEYEFLIYYATDDITSQAIGTLTGLERVTAAHLANGTLRLRGIKGTSAISSAKINKKGGGTTATYNLVLNTRENWNTKETDVEYNLTANNIGTATTLPTDLTLAAGNHTFVVGYGRFTDEEIDNFGEGDTVVISNDFPVILKKQLDTLAKTNNYRAVDFEAEEGDWAYSGRVSGMSDSNFRYTRDVHRAVVERFEDQEFEFLTFGAGVSFPTNGEMRIDAYDFITDWDNIYTYLYRDGRLTPVATTVDTGSDEIVFRTNYLGAFVMTNEQITDLDIINQPGQEAEELEPELDENNNINDIPATGSTGSLNTAVALAVVSILAAGAIKLAK